MKPPGDQFPGLVWGVMAENLVPYTQAALARFVKLVLALDVIQFRMHDESGLKANEQEGFWRHVFRMMKQTASKLRLDLRAKGLPDSVIQSAVDEGVNFRIATKYWMEQMGLPFHPTHINPENQFDRRHSYADLLRYPQRYPMQWRLWNGGTARVLLWGDPDDARRFDLSRQIYAGGGIEVNEPLCTKMEAQPHDAKPFDLLAPSHRYYDYEFERYWHFFQVFGRVGYNPDTPTEVWQREFRQRFGPGTAPFVEGGLHEASRGLRGAGLCGHWQDELAALEKGFAALERQKREFKPGPGAKSAPRLQAAPSIRNGLAPELIHRPVTTAALGTPLVITAGVHAASGVKWVRLRYRSVNQKEDYRTLLMLPTEKKDQYQALIPAADIMPTWDLTPLCFPSQ
jgi:hypothetical protein